MSVKSALEHELKSLPRDLREGALAAGALVVAHAMDNDLEAGVPEKAAGLRALQAALERLRELAPPEEEADAVNDIESQRAKRLARVSRAANKPRS